MRKKTWHRKTYLVMLACWFAVFIAAAAAGSFWYIQTSRQHLLNTVDDKMMIAAKAVKYMLAPDFHDRAVDRDAISFQEELDNRKAVSGYAQETPFTYIYTLVEKDGGFYFAAPTVTPEEAKEQTSWYFHPYEEIPAGFITAFETSRPVVTTHTDQWGTFRSIAVPEQSPGGRTYLACVDCDVSFIDDRLAGIRLKALLVSLVFLGLALPPVFLAWHALRSNKQ
jgi:hypothetical protein